MATKLDVDTGMWVNNVVNVLVYRPLITNDLNMFYLAPGLFPVFYLSGQLLYPNPLWMSLPAFVASIINVTLLYIICRNYFI